jgi:hypothetical protein
VIARKKSALIFSPARLYREVSAVQDGLSQRLTADFGKGCTRNLTYMRLFYLGFPIRHATHDESVAAEKVNAPRSVLTDPEKRAAARLELSIHRKTGDKSPSLQPWLSWTPCPLWLRVERGRI